MPADILDPTASARRDSVAVTATARRVDDLDGLRVGLLDNTKRNASDILEAIGAVFAEEDHAELVRFTKQNFAMPLTDDVIAQLTGDCDVVVIGVGDCGSCSAAAVADGIALEARGLPVAVVVTEAFDVTSRAMAKLKGREEYDYLVMPHPIANLTSDGIADRGRTLAPAVRDRVARTAELAHA